MNRVVTSAKDILAAGRELVERDGIQAVNMRSVAAACGVAVGSVYYYYPSKADLTAAIVQDIWEGILGQREESCTDSFPEYVAWLYGRMRSGTAGSSSFLAEHSLGFGNGGKGKGRQVMVNYFGRVEAALTTALRRDRRVGEGVFSETLAEEAFSGFVLRNLLGELSGGAADCGVLLEIIKKVLYEKETEACR